VISVTAALPNRLPKVSASLAAALKDFRGLRPRLNPVSFRWRPSISSESLPKVSENFRQAFQIVPKTINFLPKISENFTRKPILIKGLRPNAPAEAAKNFFVTPCRAAQGQ
jgi:hypothetical protein